MISEQPAAKAAPLLDIRDKIKAFVVTANGLAQDGLSVSDFTELAVALIKICIETLEAIPADGEQKREWTLAAVAMLYDEVADKIVPVWLWPIWMVLRAPIKQLVLMAAAGALEELLPLVRLAK